MAGYGKPRRETTFEVRPCKVSINKLGTLYNRKTYGVIRQRVGRIDVYRARRADIQNGWPCLFVWSGPVDSFVRTVYYVG